MCTLICSWQPEADVPMRMMALRDELVSRAFDDPGAWWSQPQVIGGRDRQAGGTWCASAVDTGVTAVVLNRPERPTADPGAPSRGLLPLLTLQHGHQWAQQVATAGMASFNLVLATPQCLTWWRYDGVSLTEQELTPGTHHVTPRGLIADSAWSTRDPAPDTWPAGADVASAPLDSLWGSWRHEVISMAPSSDPEAMIVARPVQTDHGPDTYATVFGQFIAARPGQLRLDYARDPHSATQWTTRVWTSSATTG